MQAVIDYLRANQTRFVRELCEYVRFASVSAQPQHRQDLQACAEWVVRHCQGIGLEARLCPTRGNPIIVAKTSRRVALPARNDPEDAPKPGPLPPPSLQPSPTGRGGPAPLTSR